jgi:hypothetical protein
MASFYTLRHSCTIADRRRQGILVRARYLADSCPPFFCLFCGNEKTSISHTAITLPMSLREDIAIRHAGHPSSPLLAPQQDGIDTGDDGDCPSSSSFSVKEETLMPQMGVARRRSSCLRLQQAGFDSCARRQRGMTIRDGDYHPHISIRRHRYQTQQPLLLVPVQQQGITFCRDGHPSSYFDKPTSILGIATTPPLTSLWREEGRMQAWR